MVKARRFACPAILCIELGDFSGRAPLAPKTREKCTELGGQARISALVWLSLRSWVQPLRSRGAPTATATT